MLEDDLFLDEEELTLNLEEYTKGYTQVKVKHHSTEITIYDTKVDTARYLLSERYLMFILHEVPNKTGLYTMQAINKGFPPFKSSSKDCTQQELEDYINRYLVKNKENIIHLLNT